MEIWKDIPGYEGFYQASDMGRVRRLESKITHSTPGYTKTWRGCILKPAEHSHGYLKISLTKNGKPKNYYLHRLVCETFLDNKAKLPQVNHKNGDKRDNRITNLHWCTAAKNSKHGYWLNPKLNHTAYKPVRVWCKNNGLIYESISSACRALNLSVGNVSLVINKKRPNTMGYVFERLA